MFESNRRSGISTSELGLYSDRGEHCHRSGYGTIVIKQFVVVVMIIITVVLIALYVYDVTSSTSILHKPNFKTKHLHIYQNNFVTPNVTVGTLNPTFSISPKEEDTVSTVLMQDRSDTVDCDKFEENMATGNKHFKLESRAQTLQNFQLKNKVLQQIKEQHEEANEEQHFFNNHAMVYRIKPSSKKIFVGNVEDDLVPEESDPEPSPFHFEFKTPYPSSFKRLKYPQLTQYRYPHSSRSIQDIIKYMVNDPTNPHRGIKFTGVYLNPKKYDTEEAEYPDETLLEEESSTPIAMTSSGDPLYRYKPKHPADVNLLAPSNFRFSPLGIQRFNPYNLDPYYYRPGIGPYYKPTQQLDTSSAYTINNNNNNINNNINNNNNNGDSKKRKAKPFSVMLDIYPITDINEYQSKKTVSRPRPPIEFEDYDLKRPIKFMPRFPKHHQVPVALPNRQNFRDEEEKQQMILHLNLYPRKKGRSNRNDILHQSESRLTEETQHDLKKTESPFQMLTKQLTDHFTIEEAKLKSNESNEKLDMKSEKLNDVQKLHLYQKAQNSVFVTEKSVVVTMQTSSNSTQESLLMME